MLDDVLRDISEDETLKMFMHAGEVQPPSSHMRLWKEFNKLIFYRALNSTEAYTRRCHDSNHPFRVSCNITQDEGESIISIWWKMSVIKTL